MKNYTVTIGESNFTVQATDLKEAKNLAKFHKRMEKTKGKIDVRLIKND